MHLSTLLLVIAVGLTAEEALDAVLRTSGLTFQRTGSRVVVTRGK